MSTETFIVCDRCGDSVRRATADDVKDWRIVSLENPHSSSFWAFVKPTAEDDRPTVWHLCPKCAPTLAEWFTAKPVAGEQTEVSS